MTMWRGWMGRAAVAAGFWAVLGIWVGARADGPTTAPAAAPPNLEHLKAVAADMQDAAQQMKQYIHSPADMIDPAKRASVASNVLPLLKRIRSDGAQLSSFSPQIKIALMQFDAFLSLFDDPETNTNLKTAAAGTGDDALNAQCSLALADWCRDAQDATAQAKVVADFKKTVQANPQAQVCAVTALTMLQIGASSPDQTQAIRKIISDDLKNPDAQAEALEMEQAQDSQQKIAQTENKPLTISGTLVDGKSFTTADWKGKVILVDFWATWCGPCLAELPRVSKAYSDYHDKGLEILGVSNDYKADDLTTFLGQHKEMPWPQLFDAGAAAQQHWNPITMGFGIDGIPTMFLIDRKGVCRTVSARENLEDMIPKLLAESAN